jgi:hypothetical protein
MLVSVAREDGREGLVMVMSVDAREDDRRG